MRRNGAGRVRLTFLLALMAPLGALGVLAPAGELLTVSAHSDALSREAVFDVFLPAQESPDGAWPVLYLLHGAWGNHTDWWRNTDVEEVAEECGVMLVFPDGGQFGWYLDSPREPTSQYESFLIDELVPLIDRAFSTRRDRAARGLCGLSMGGHGAISLAAKHPGLFGAASSLSGALDLTALPTSYELPLRLGPLDENRESWEANSALHLAERFQSADVGLMFDCGVDDSLVIEENRAFRRRLMQLGVAHTYTEHPGTHSWAYWRTHIGAHVRWHAAQFTRPQSPDL